MLMEVRAVREIRIPGGLGPDLGLGWSGSIRSTRLLGVGAVLDKANGTVEGVGAQGGIALGIIIEVEAV